MDFLSFVPATTPLICSLSNRFSRFWVLDKAALAEAPSSQPISELTWTQLLHGLFECLIRSRFLVDAVAGIHVCNG